MKVTAIIPARGGSKGIPKKNIVDFCGKPLIAWSIIQAVNTKEISSVYVTSDSEEILSVSEKYGARKIKRPPEISGDKASSETAIEHALGEIKESVDLVIFMQPTSPLRKLDDLPKALIQFQKEKDDSMFSGAVLEDFLIWEKGSTGIPESRNYDYKNRGIRQNRKLQYVENGSFYLFKPQMIKNENNRLGGKIGIYLMESWQMFEIDSSKDLDFTEMLFKIKLQETYLKY